jgi:lipoprotein-anchoring transpeptidase ErfK/SrfK
MQPSRLRIEISVATQRLQLWEGFHLLNDWPCSTSKFGLGFTEGSNKTPLGHFLVQEKHGTAAPIGTIFRARVPVGQWNGEQVPDDLILTRILRLAGREPRNANTFDRYVYIHGTNDELKIGQPASHGCIRLKTEALIELYDRVPEGTEVWIGE